MGLISILSLKQRSLKYIWQSAGVIGIKIHARYGRQGISNRPLYIFPPSDKEGLKINKNYSVCEKHGQAER